MVTDAAARSEDGCDSATTAGAHLAEANAEGSTDWVATRKTFAARPAEVWKRLLLYEQIERRPPLHLRLLLPVPTGTSGGKSQVGDVARCLYESGHLVKRITRVSPGRHYAFDIADQLLDVGGGVKLLGGSYTLRETPNGGTEVELVTRYRGARRPRWLWRPVEAAVCHSFHRYILASMRRDRAPR